MNTRERFLNTIEFKEIDRTFRWEASFFWSQTIDRWHNEGLPGHINGSNISSYLGMDPICWIPVEGDWAGNPYCPMFEEMVICEEGDNITRMERDGIVKKRKKSAFDGTAPQLLKFPVETMGDFENIKSRLDYRSKERLPVNWDELVTKYKQRDYPLGMYVLGTFGFTKFKTLLSAAIMERRRSSTCYILV